MITTQTVEQEAKVYLFDLDNCAREFGFKEDEGWELSLASATDKALIEKQYYPTMSAKVFPEILSELFNIVNSKLTKVKPGFVNAKEPLALSGQNLQYIVAFNPKRVIR